MESVQYESWLTEQKILQTKSHLETGIETAIHSIVLFGQL
jgi:hypothetical protein